MPYLQLTLVSPSIEGQENGCRFSAVGGSVGRSDACDWTLIDADRVISKQHFLISFEDGKFVITDVSSNGVLINEQTKPLGKNNQTVLNNGDRIRLGKHQLKVEAISLEERPSTAPSISPSSGAFGHASGTSGTVATSDSSSDLLGLVMGGSDVPDVTSSPSPRPSSDLSIEASNLPDRQARNEESLTDILSTPTESMALPSGSSENAAKENTDISQAKSVPLSVQSDPSGGTPISQPSGNLIPDDWELGDDTPTIPTSVPEQPARSAATTVRTKPGKSEQGDGNATAQALSGSDKPSYSESAHEPFADDFFTLVYDRLGLPKEYLSSVDKHAFAEEIVDILMTSTAGLMSLLNARTVFKQEARLSATLIQPRSNNPIKFSIDATDTLEMLLLKKKKGYLPAKAAFEEAMNDVQLHQMAFLSGLQASLSGVLKELSPEKIERQASEKGQNFMGLNKNSQSWHLYKEKQSQLLKRVTENLNDVLGAYFSDAYQAQINSIKDHR